LNAQFSTDLHQTCDQGRVPRDVIAYCFGWKSGTSMSAKPEVELIFTTAAAKSEKRPRNHFRGDGMLAVGTHVSWLI